MGSLKHDATVWSLWTQLLCVTEGPVNTASGLNGKLPVFEWWIAQLQTLYAASPAINAAPGVQCTAEQRSYLQQVVLSVDKWVGRAIILTRRHASRDAMSSSLVFNRGAYASQHKYLRARGMSLYLNAEGSPNVLQEIYQPALERINQCRHVHIEIAAARNIAHIFMNFLLAIGLSHIAHLGFVLCPADTPPKEHLVLIDAGQGIEIRPVSAAESVANAMHAPSEIKRASRTIRQNPAFGKVYPQVYQ